MLDEDGAKNLLNEMCRTGKRVSIVVEITDSEKAIELMRSMYTGAGYSGLIVQSWGGFDVEGALNRKLSAIDELNRKHQEEMAELLTPNNLRDFAENL